MKPIVSTMVVLAFITTACPAAAKVLPGDCLVQEIAAYDNRVHLFCADLFVRSDEDPWHKNGQTYGNYYVAVESNSSLAAQTIMLVMGARIPKVTRSTLIVMRVFYDDDTSHNPAGCLAKNCYRFTGISLTP